jgi:hypothetical protein
MLAFALHKKVSESGRRSGQDTDTFSFGQRPTINGHRKIGHQS